MSARYRQYLLERFEGEVEGEAFFLGLQERSEDADIKAKWSALARLETETRAHLKAALDELALVPPPASASVERGRHLAAHFSRMPWPSFMQAFCTGLEGFVTQFKAAEALMPQDGKEAMLLRHITRHEQALLVFAVRELQGRGHESLEAVTSLLGKPLNSFESV
mgnify:CR=1 FL=1